MEHNYSIGGLALPVVPVESGTKYQSVLLKVNIDNTIAPGSSVDVKR
jgi:hypothetical protein